MPKKHLLKLRLKKLLLKPKPLLLKKRLLLKRRRLSKKLLLSRKLLQPKKHLLLQKSAKKRLRVNPWHNPAPSRWPPFRARMA